MGLVRRLKRLLRGPAAPPNPYAGLDIGEGTRLFPSEHLDGMFPALAHIGKNCVFAPGSMVLTHDASYWRFTGEYRVAPVYIGDNVFVGFGAVIMPGVRVGSNVVIGAGSVVTRDVASGTVVVGSPAKPLCTIEEYLARRRMADMVTPPYGGKLPSEVTGDDVAEFRRMVYARHAAAPARNG